MKFKVPRFRNLDRFRVYAGLVIVITLVLWYRSSRQWDSVSLSSQYRIYEIQSGFGEICFEISGQIGRKWRLDFESVQTNNSDWPGKPLRYERRLLSMTLGVAYWAIVLSEVALLTFLIFRRKKGGKRRASRPRKKAKKSA